MTTATPAYQSAVTHTITLASLASSATAGREGTVIDQAGTDDAIDAIVGGKITTGTSPTGGFIFVYLYGSHDGTLYSGGAAGADGALTPQSESLMRLLIAIPVSTTSNQQYNFGPYSVAAAFGGTLPRKWGVYIRQTSAVNLHATSGNHEIKHTPVKYESA